MLSGMPWFRLVFIGLHRASCNAVDIFHKFRVCCIAEDVCGAGRGCDLKQVDLHSLAEGFFLIWINTVMESSAQYCGKGLTNTELCT